MSPAGELSLNVLGLRAVLAWIDLFPERFDQRPPTLRSPGTMSFAWITCLLAKKAGRFDPAAPTTVRDVERLARDLLGLTDAQAARIFRYLTDEGRTPTPAQIRQRVAQVTGADLDGPGLRSLPDAVAA